MDIFNDPSEVLSISGSEFDALSSSEQFSRLREAVAYERFSPEVVDELPDQSQYENPAIRFSVEGKNAEQLCQQYVLLEGAIERLVSESPFIEVGAGVGYLSYVINANGGDSIASDPYRYGVAQSYPATVTVTRPDESTSTFRLWNDVIQCGFEVMKEYPERSVLICHPSSGTPWSEEVLELAAAQEQTVYYVGDWYPGVDATPRFFKTLVDEWRLEWCDNSVYSFGQNEAALYRFEVA